MLDVGLAQAAVSQDSATLLPLKIFHSHSMNNDKKIKYKLIWEPIEVKLEIVFEQQVLFMVLD